MKKTISTALCVMIFLGFCVFCYSQYQQSQKEIVRSRFLEIKSLGDSFFLGKSFSRTKESTMNPLSAKMLESKYFDSISEKLQYISPSFLIETSPDYKEILETGLYLEGGSIESGGYYNIENLTDSINSFIYNYNIEDIKQKGCNKYDVCISGTFAYSLNTNSNTDASLIVRGPYRISICYPFVLENDNITIDSKEFTKRLNKK